MQYRRFWAQLGSAEDPKGLILHLMWAWKQPAATTAELQACLGRSGEEAMLVSCSGPR